MSIHGYSKAIDFPGGISLKQLFHEIKASAIFQELDQIKMTSDLVEISFKTDLTQLEKQLLDGLQINPAGGIIGKHAAISPELLENLIYPKYIDFDRVWMFAHDLADKTTWFNKSIKVINEVLIGQDGVKVDFNLGHTHLIDLKHGLLSQEDLITLPNSTDRYYPVLIKNNDILIEREYGETSGGDFTINYATGVVTFFVAPLLLDTLSISYYYADQSTLILAPGFGKRILLDFIEIQFSKNLDLTDEINVGVYTYNPYLGAPPSKFLYAPSLSIFKRAYDFINWTKGSYPIIPAFGGATRGFLNDIIQLRFEYNPPLDLRWSTGAELRVWTKHHREIGGDVATFCGYGKITAD
jgi:hypothetical protein